MKTSWGAVASWYDSVVNDKDSYQSRVILPNVLRLIAPKRGDKILDLACGQGFFSHALAAEGAFVTGIDVAPELIDIARTHAVHKQEFFVASAENLKPFADKSFDAAVCILAIQNIERMALAFKEVARVLKPGGKLVLVLNHPTFRIPGKTSWGFDEGKNLTTGASKKTGIVQYRRIDEYMSESRAAIDMNPGTTAAVKKETTYSFHRPLQVYSKNLANAGLAIKRLEEWLSHRESEAGPRKAAEDKARKEIPLFMCLECVKL